MYRHFYLSARRAMRCPEGDLARKAQSNAYDTTPADSRTEHSSFRFLLAFVCP